MLARLTDRALSLWLAYVRRVRNDERNADARAAAIIAAIFETNRNPKRRSQAYTARDFIPKYPGDPPPAPINAAPTPVAGRDRRMSADDSARHALSIFERATRS